jgi:hypothetical protein
MRRSQLTLLLATLCGYGGWNLWLGWQTAFWSFWLISALCLSGTLGVLMNRRLFTGFIYLAAAWVVGEWLLSVLFSWRTGYFSHLRMSAFIATMAPGLGVTLWAAYCCFIAWRLVGRR